MPVKSVYLVIMGRVQGVGFRYFVEHKAIVCHISGWVKNTPDGSVEIEATGEPENLNVFIDWMKIGPTRAIIKTCSVSEITPTRIITNFTIR
jgi:acylphosphatase